MAAYANGNTVKGDEVDDAAAAEAAPVGYDSDYTALYELRRGDARRYAGGKLDAKGSECAMKRNVQNALRIKRASAQRSCAQSANKVCTRSTFNFSVASKNATHRGSMHSIFCFHLFNFTLL